MTLLSAISVQISPCVLWWEWVKLFLWLRITFVSETHSSRPYQTLSCFNWLWSSLLNATMWHSSQNCSNVGEKCVIKKKKKKSMNHTGQRVGFPLYGKWSCLQCPLLIVDQIHNKCPLAVSRPPPPIILLSVMGADDLVMPLCSFIQSVDNICLGTMYSSVYTTCTVAVLFEYFRQ